MNPLFVSKIFAALFLFTAFFCVNLPARGEEKNCVISSARDIVDCVTRNHPDVLQAELAQNRDASLIKVARQRPNPELESRVVADGEFLGTETTLLHTLEVGGKRSARIKGARAEHSLTEAHHLESVEQASLETVLTLYRLRQIREEKSILNETSHTFRRLVGQIKGRTLRSPEQEVSLSVFELALRETDLKTAALLQEEERFKNWLQWATGVDFNHIKNYLPGTKKGWPEAAHSKEEETLDHSQIRVARAELERAQAGRWAASAQAWPNLRIGPTFETERTVSGGEDNRLFYGGQLSFDLPVLSLKRGEKRFAALEAKRAEGNFISTRRKTAVERYTQVERYRMAVKSLRATPTRGALDQIHRDIDRQVDRGFVQAGLVIEAHRQVFDTATGRNEQELAAIDALWRIAIIDGRLGEEKI